MIVKVVFFFFNAKFKLFSPTNGFTEVCVLPHRCDHLNFDWKNPFFFEVHNSSVL
jgi:hypothetical protein